MRRRIFLLGAIGLGTSACVAPIAEMSVDPLLYNANELATAGHIVFAAPGALTSVSVLEPVVNWSDPDVAVVLYRLPGLDGLPRSPALSIERAARQMATLAARFPGKRISFVGFSTGAGIGLEAAALLNRQGAHSDIRVAALSSALPAPQPTLAGFRGAGGVLASATRAGSLQRTAIWNDYYKTLLYGRGYASDPVKAARAEEILLERSMKTSMPDPRLGREHSASLVGWDGPDPDALAGVRVTFFHGEDDPVFPPRALRRYAARLPDADVQIYPDHAHLLLVTYSGLKRDIAGVLGIVP